MINGKTYSGNNVSMNGNKIIIDGKDVTGEYEEDKEITINILGNIKELNSGYGVVTVEGNVQNLSNSHGDNNVKGDITNSIKNSHGDNNIVGNVDGCNVTNTHGNNNGFCEQPNTTVSNTHGKDNKEPKLKKLKKITNLFKDLFP